MATRHPADEADIRQRIDKLAGAVHAMDLEAHSLNRLSGTLKNGTTTSGFWVRATVCFQKINGDWFIAHDQVSVPIDLATGAALLNLEP
jgi:ketosteroid isomerase-like protein